MKSTIHKLSLLFILFLSLTFGATSGALGQWKQVMPLDTTIPLDVDFNCFGVNGSYIFASFENSSDGIFRSTDDGASWNFILNDTQDYLEDPYNVQDFAVIGNTLFAAGSGYSGDFVFKSTDNGVSWAADGLYDNYVVCLTAIGTNLFAGTYDSGVYLSTNNGTSWLAMNTGLQFYHFNNADSGICVSAFAVMGTTLFAILPYVGLFRTTDNGSTWTNTGPNSEAVQETPIAVIGSSLFEGTIQPTINYDTDAVVVSSDSGSSWRPLNNGLPITTDGGVGSFAVSGPNLFASYGGSVYLSTDNGNSWTDVSSGLTPSSNNEEKLAVTDEYLFEGTDAQGIWRRPLSEMIPTLSAVTQPPPSPPQIQSYPNPFSQATTVTFSPQTAGFAEVTVVNLLGAQVVKLFSGELSAGEHSFSWDASGMSPGMYECIVRMNGQVQRVGMVLDN